MWSAPLVEDSEKLQAKAAGVEAERLRAGELSGFEVRLLHGQMSSAEKSEAMERFVARRIDVLVATTVIEVGIDVPNATVMLIEGAERYGLSQLHQLRGRVGRGGHELPLHPVRRSRVRARPPADGGDRDDPRQVRASPRWT